MTLAEDEPEAYYEPVMQILTAFIREKVPWSPGAATPEPSPAPLSIGVPDDVEVALTVLLRRDAEHDTGCLDLSRTNLQRVSFHGELTDICFDGANLSGAFFSDATLIRVSFGDSTILTDASFRSATLHCSSFLAADLPRAKFGGATLDFVSFQGAKIETATFNEEAPVAQFEKVIIDDATRLPDRLSAELSGDSYFVIDRNLQSDQEHYRTKSLTLSEWSNNCPNPFETR